LNSRIKINRKFKVEIELELDVEYSNLFQESTIVGAKASPSAVITPRIVNASMQHGDYADLDRMVCNAIGERFLKSVSDHTKNYPNHPPSHEIRSVPLNPSAWSSMMRKAYKHCAIPIDQLVKLASSWRVNLEPVFGDQHTVYMWPMNASERLIDRIKDFEIHRSSLNNPTMTPLDDGSICLKWQYK